MKEKTKHKLKKTDAELGDAYTFVGIERTSKLALGFHLGRRTSEDASIFMAKIDAATSGRFQISTDGFNGYPVSGSPAGADLHLAHRADEPAHPDVSAALHPRDECFQPQAGQPARRPGAPFRGPTGLQLHVDALQHPDDARDEGGDCPETLDGAGSAGGLSRPVSCILLKKSVHVSFFIREAEYIHVPQ